MTTRASGSNLTPRVRRGFDRGVGRHPGCLRQPIDFLPTPACCRSLGGRLCDLPNWAQTREFRRARPARRPIPAALPRLLSRCVAVRGTRASRIPQEGGGALGRVPAPTYRAPFAASAQDPAREAPAGPRKVPAFLDAHVREAEGIPPPRRRSSGGGMLSVGSQPALRPNRSSGCQRAAVRALGLRGAVRRWLLDLFGLTLRLVLGRGVRSLFRALLQPGLFGHLFQPLGEALCGCFRRSMSSLASNSSSSCLLALFAFSNHSSICLSSRLRRDCLSAPASAISETVSSCPSDAGASGLATRKQAWVPLRARDQEREAQISHERKLPGVQARRSSGVKPTVQSSCDASLLEAQPDAVALIVAALDDDAG